MRTRLLFVVLTLLSALGFSAPAMAQSSFTGTILFDGACSDCSASGGAGTASATISLTDYNWGDDLPDSVGFTYTSELLGTLSPIYAYNVIGSFASAASAPANVYLEFNIYGEDSSAGFYMFESYDDSSWELTKGISVAPADFGESHTWSAAAPVPEPEIYAMLGMGLGLLGWVGRRRKQLAA